MMAARALLVSAMTASAFAAPALAQDACGALENYREGHTTVVSARSVSDEGHTPFCSVEGVSTPGEGSRIGFAVMLPSKSAWTGRLRMFGNGGYSSTMPTERMIASAKRGTVAVATDTGHRGDDPSFAIGRPASVDDWGWRAVHESVKAAKALAHAYYGMAPRYNYFEGCSTGGHQALMEAQRFPDDFDGIVAGAPGSNRTRLNLGFLWQFKATHGEDGALLFAPAKLRLLTRHALASCGSAAEQAAGFLLDPLICRPDPGGLQCDAGDDGAQCLTPHEVSSARLMYAGARTTSGEQVYPPWLPGSESIGPPDFPLPGWSLYWADPARPDRPARESFFRFWAFPGERWHWQDFDFDTAVKRMQQLSERIDAVDADLSAFRASGGRLLQFHGLADPVVSPWDSVAYHAEVVRRSGPDAGSFYRLFMVPGMGHCAGGPGYGALETGSAIEAWVERGIAPASLTGIRTDEGGRGMLPDAIEVNPWEEGVGLDAVRVRAPR